jgi:hypothetical protein
MKLCLRLPELSCVKPIKLSGVPCIHLFIGLLAVTSEQKHLLLRAVLLLLHCWLLPGAAGSPSCSNI